MSTPGIDDEDPVFLQFHVRMVAPEFCRVEPVRRRRRPSTGRWARLNAPVQVEAMRRAVRDERWKKKRSGRAAAR